MVTGWLRNNNGTGMVRFWESNADRPLISAIGQICFLWSVREIFLRQSRSHKDVGQAKVSARMTFPVSDIGTLCPCHKGSPPSPEEWGRLATMRSFDDHGSMAITIPNTLDHWLLSQNPKPSLSCKAFVLPKCCPPHPFYAFCRHESKLSLSKLSSPTSKETIATVKRKGPGSCKAGFMSVSCTWLSVKLH
ncbi:hypothetical protein CDAR_589201 [Caerostris darwini]|uniref:Uncharacterized protein n=1 Tax=Caerostris darwini TaxID=1538125 RepID=A0AAV4TBJ2_9ARAC|nr:hypothetical protein CDAR_589201 [Caerostris darwini]